MVVLQFTSSYSSSQLAHDKPLLSDSISPMVIPLSPSQLAHDEPLCTYNSSPRVTPLNSAFQLAHDELLYSHGGSPRAFTSCDVNLVPIHSLNPFRIRQPLSIFRPTFPLHPVGVVTYGARLGYEGRIEVQVRLKNHMSAFSQPDVLDNTAEDLILDRTPVANPLPPNYYISP